MFSFVCPGFSLDSLPLSKCQTGITISVFSLGKRKRNASQHMGSVTQKNVTLFHENFTTLPEKKPSSFFPQNLILLGVIL